MRQSLHRFLNAAREIFQKLTKNSRTVQLVIIFHFISIPFFIYHEWHLPIHYILSLVTLASLCSTILIYLTLYLIGIYVKNPFHPGFELLAGIIFIFSLWLSDVFQFRAGKVFFFICISFTLILRFLQMEAIVRILFVSFLLIGTSLVSFKALQSVEIVSSYLLFKNKFKFEEVDVNNWVVQDRNYWNEEIHLGFTLPEEFIFFKASDLSLENQTGVGQIAGIIGSSEQDPNRYPFIRMFYFPAYVPFEIEEANRDISEFLRIQVSKAEIEDLQEIVLEDKTILNLGSKYWTFFDLLRPRYAKTGFLLLENNRHDKILLHITENLEKDQVHEEGILSILKSLRFSD
ncbi:hypothetical protein LPTSP4_29220 [Leptospira ryugenii]|uniref:Uncharacterized protein n=1 Tax=Leptospira ryugenii TaxID=1917863 RepID=A0A2P2E3I4_9LEPT|nr:hypothetical protein [Leptospira ryugenii]GBF51386.1 hypothetical protein LPTSP4_29220 [Leptospira ryugenii]